MVKSTAWIESDARAWTLVIFGLFAFRSAADRGGLPEIDAVANLRVGLFDAKPGHVERGKEDEGQKRRDRQAPHDCVGHRTPAEGLGGGGRVSGRAAVDVEAMGR